MSGDQFGELALILQEVFDDPTLNIERTTTVSDIAGWDSFSHNVLLLTLNDRFKIRLSTAMEFNNVGELSGKISELIGKA